MPLNQLEVQLVPIGQWCFGQVQFDFRLFFSGWTVKSNNTNQQL